jgi:hypothetical protein
MLIWCLDCRRTILAACTLDELDETDPSWHADEVRDFLKIEAARLLAQDDDDQDAGWDDDQDDDDDDDQGDDQAVDD